MFLRPVQTGTSRCSASECSRVSLQSTVGRLMRSRAAEQPLARPSFTTTRKALLMKSHVISIVVVTFGVTLLLAGGRASEASARRLDDRVVIDTPCAGDCDANGRVSIGDLVTAINIALGRAPVIQCQAVDADDNGNVSIDEL